MLSLAPTTAVYLYSQPADMRKSFNGLAGLVTAASGDQAELLQGGLFVFHNKRRNAIKILYFDCDGLAIWYKRLEKGVFVFPPSAEGHLRLAVEPSDLRLILDGIDLKSVKRLKRYTPLSPDSSVTDDRRTDRRI